MQIRNQKPSEYSHNTPACSHVQFDSIQPGNQHISIATDSSARFILNNISDPDYMRELGILPDTLIKRYAHHPAVIHA